MLSQEINEKYAEDRCNKIPTPISSGTGGQCQAAAPVYDPKAMILSKLDFAQERLVRQLTVISELRRELNWSSHREVVLLEKFLQIEGVLNHF